MSDKLGSGEGGGDLVEGRLGAHHLLQSHQVTNPPSRETTGYEPTFNSTSPPSTAQSQDTFTCDSTEPFSTPATGQSRLSTTCNRPKPLLLHLRQDKAVVDPFHLQPDRAVIAHLQQDRAVLQHMTSDYKLQASREGSNVT